MHLWLTRIILLPFSLPTITITTRDYYDEIKEEEERDNTTNAVVARRNQGRGRARRETQQPMTTLEYSSSTLVGIHPDILVGLGMAESTNWSWPSMTQDAMLSRINLFRGKEDSDSCSDTPSNGMSLIKKKQLKVLLTSLRTWTFCSASSRNRLLNSKRIAWKQRI